MDKRVVMTKREWLHYTNKGAQIVFTKDEINRGARRKDGFIGRWNGVDYYVAKQLRPQSAYFYCYGCKGDRTFRKVKVSSGEGKVKLINAYQCPKCGHLEDYELTNLMLEQKRNKTNEMENQRRKSHR